MKKEEKSVSILQQFLPAGTFDLVAVFFKENTIYLNLTHERKSVLGDYRHPTKVVPQHRISVNANLNPYSFLITLLHEIAHMQTFQNFGNRVAPHGKEWKAQFRHILLPFIGKKFFPQDVEKSLQSYLNDPAASTCTDPHLFKALYKYDDHKPGFKLVDDIAQNSFFETDDGEKFQKVEKLRTRTRCKNLNTGKHYFFQGIIEVKEIN